METIEFKQEFPAIEAKRRQGDEKFHDAERLLGFDLKDFWQWSASDVISNTTRGILAEYLVSQAVGVAEGVREEWAPYDIKATDGTCIEVKSAAYLQSWHQDRLSKILFNAPKTQAWDPAAGSWSKEIRRQADVYVFCLLAHREQDTLDPLDVSQWQFFVVLTTVLDACLEDRKGISLSLLRDLAGKPVTYFELKQVIEVVTHCQTKRAQVDCGQTTTEAPPSQVD